MVKGKSKPKQSKSPVKPKKQTKKELRNLAKKEFGDLYPLTNIAIDEALEGTPTQKKRIGLPLGTNLHIEIRASEETWKHLLKLYQLLERQEKIEEYEQKLL